MSDSILGSTKKSLGLGEEATVFDPELIMHINSAFSDLNQLGLGPDAGFAIEDDEATWDAFIGDDERLNSVKTLMYLKVKLVFDPPPTSFVIAAYEKQIEKFEWRLNVQRESENWVDPVNDVEAEEVLDGGEV